MLVQAAEDRQKNRSKTLAGAAKLQTQREMNQSCADHLYTTVTFNDLKLKICKGLNESTSSMREKGKIKKSSFADRRLKVLHGNAINLPSRNIAKSQCFSMLEVNKTHYEQSLKKFKLFTLQRKKREQQKNGDLRCMSENRGRSMQQIWHVLKLEQVLQSGERLHLQNNDGKAFYKAHMRKVKHLVDVKSYRPKTISSNCRVKTEYVQYLRNAV